MSAYNTTLFALRHAGAATYSAEYARVAFSLASAQVIPQASHVVLNDTVQPNDNTGADRYVSIFLGDAAACAAAERIRVAIIADDDSVDGDDVALLEGIGATAITFGLVEPTVEVTHIGTSSETTTRTVTGDHTYVLLSDL